MGVKLYYSGVLKSFDLLEALKGEVYDLCQAHQWQFHDLAEFNNSDDLKAQPKELLLQGFVFGPSDLEPIYLTFDYQRRLISPVHLAMEEATENGQLKDEAFFATSETQKGGVDYHIALVGFFKYISSKYFSSWSCVDDTEYYDHGDKDKLQKAMLDIERMMGSLQEAFDMHADKLSTSSPEEVKSFIQDVLKHENVDIKEIRVEEEE